LTPKKPVQPQNNTIIKENQSSAVFNLTIKTVPKNFDMFNKYFKDTDISTNIKIRFRVTYRITSPEDENLSDDPYANWRDFTNRDGGVTSGLIADVLTAQIPTLNRPASIYWNSPTSSDQMSRSRVSLFKLFRPLS
jgi:hypothetical protein